jgi:hypothetical protein
MKTPNTMKNKRLVIAVTFLIGVSVWHQCRESILQKKLVSDLHLSLTGVILSKNMPKQCKGLGIIRLRVIDSNIKQYNQRGNEPYYAFIQDDKALIFTGCSVAKIGDTIIVNTDLETVVNLAGQYSFDTKLVQHEPFWDAVRKQDLITQMMSDTIE